MSEATTEVRTVVRTDTQRALKELGTRVEQNDIPFKDGVPDVTRPETVAFLQDSGLIKQDERLLDVKSREVSHGDDGYLYLYTFTVEGPSGTHTTEMLGKHMVSWGMTGELSEKAQSEALRVALINQATKGAYTPKVYGVCGSSIYREFIPEGQKPSPADLSQQLRDLHDVIKTLGFTGVGNRNNKPEALMADCVIGPNGRIVFVDGGSDWNEIKDIPATMAVANRLSQER